MLIYFLIYIPFILCAYLDFKETLRSTKNEILWTWVVVFTFFRGLRWETGTDWEQFYYVYNHSDWSNIFNFARYGGSEFVMDSGYMFINCLFHSLKLPYTVFLLATNFWIMWCFKDFSERHTKYPIMTLILLINVGIPFPVRQTIAFATSFWGYRFAVERKWVNYIMVTIIAALIHKASLICLLIILALYAIDKWYIKWQWYAIAYASTYLFADFLRESLSSVIMWVSSSGEQLEVYASHYVLSEKASEYESMLSGFSYLLFFCLLLFVREKYGLSCRIKVKHFETFFFLYVVGAVISNLIRVGAQTGMTEILGRVISTIDMFPIIFPLVFVLFLLNDLRNRDIVFCIFVIYMFYKFWKQIAGSFYSFLYIPYQSIFDV